MKRVNLLVKRLEACRKAKMHELKIEYASVLYADDTTLYNIGLDKDTLENNLQQSLNLLKMWCL